MMRNSVKFVRAQFLRRFQSSDFSRQAKTMAFNKRKEVPLKHLFDSSELNVYDTKIVNLSAGTPGPELLKDCCQLFKTATDHRMVSRIKEPFTCVFLVKFISINL